ncbi:hypothetical protein Dda_3051 [Drechslerella dactyloides]|uniref:Uncharacterized protein n=1 Tax=Drechslerella dactyloides TaxID=74499 RepID=A0AAD6J515_DREDA|nr:hypothetical protein Dda_3051 [Drechslerella dactyloides]
MGGGWNAAEEKFDRRTGSSKEQQAEGILLAGSVERWGWREQGGREAERILVWKQLRKASGGNSGSSNDSDHGSRSSPVAQELPRFLLVGIITGVAEREAGSR